MPITSAQLQQLRTKARCIQGGVTLKHSAIQLWPYITDNDNIDKHLGLNKVYYQHTPIQPGYTELLAEQSGPLLHSVYQELPYEWIPPYYMSVERVYQKGILRYLSVVWHLDDTPDIGGCQLVCKIYYVARYPLLPIHWALNRFIQQACALYQDIDQKVPARQLLGFEVFFRSSAEQAEAIKQLTQNWHNLLPDSEVPAALANYIYTAPDKAVARLRPFEVADYHQLPRLEVLRFCLLATQAGFLNLSWDILCPSCQGASTQVGRLDYLGTTAHCETCNIHYDAHFDQNVEVTFSPRSDLRTLDRAHYCIANPKATPHIWAQLTIDPQQKRTIELQLPAGHYRLRSPMLEGEVYWQVITEQLEQPPLTQLILPLHTGLTADATQRLAPKTQVIFHNERDEFITLKLEKLDHQGRIATAALVTTLQDFRALFSSEVLRPGVQLGISNLVLLFTDLKNSTALYETHGDASAFSFVQAHFDILTTIIGQHQGGIVKTIGDAVMAAFNSPSDAVQAGLSILHHFTHYNQQHPAETHLSIKLGLHCGPCILLNLNERLDYFGSTVNIAARIEGMSKGDDMVLSSKLYEIDEVQTLLAAESDIIIAPFSARLKGIHDEQQLYRIALR